MQCIGNGFVLAAVIALVLGFAWPANAQTGGPYDLSWNVVAGGGGKSRDGTGLYSLRGTMGQPATGTMAGGAYTLTGGFWAVPPNAPADIDGDGHVDVTDLLWLASTWAKNEGDPGFDPAADFNDDGAVDVSDLLFLAEYWAT